ncbi:MAG: polyphosphate polymerase domain-containing protein [Lachnospiraceae bacterium]|nr:polyphosphate polymerase domain-containing protein [Lachnospiraceae bacterium]
MDYQQIFKRHEIKYLLSMQEKEFILEAIKPYMQPGQYGYSTIRNVYFDTDTFCLIRHSLEKPVYKEKLRLRSYRAAKGEDNVFVELKKKYKSVVYKRRLVLTESQAWECFQKDIPLPSSSQIANEIEYFRDFYKPLYPKVFISYSREAYEMIDGSDFRVTFDRNILYRQEDFSFASGIYGTPILNEGETLMEIKTPGAIPLWLCRKLTEMQIFKTSFSKYGLAYQDIFKNGGGLKYA